MNVNKETMIAFGKLAVGQMLGNRISRLANASDLTKKHNQLKGITFEAVREASGWDEDIEALAAVAFSLMPELKDGVRAQYDDLIKQRIEWATPKDKKRAEF